MKNNKLKKELAAIKEKQYQENIYLKKAIASLQYKYNVLYSQALGVTK